MVDRGDDIKYPKGVISQWKDRIGTWVSGLENIDSWSQLLQVIVESLKIGKILEK